MDAVTSQITSLTTVYSTIYSSADQRKKIKAPRPWSLWGEFTGDRWIHRTNGQWRGKYIHLMTSSWFAQYNWRNIGYLRLPETHLNTLRPGQDGRYIPDDIFECIFFNENVKISIKISLKFVLKGPINIIPALVQIMAWRRPGDKPLSEPIMVSLLTHICVTRPQWVKLKSLETSFVHNINSFVKSFWIFHKAW